VLFAMALLFVFGTVGPGFAGSITSIIVCRTITGFGTLGPILATVGIGTVNVVATILAMGLIDRAGRLPLSIGGLVPMAQSLIVLAIALLGGRGAAWANMVAISCRDLTRRAEIIPTSARRVAGPS
jgi:sugar transport protein